MHIRSYNLPTVTPATNNKANNIAATQERDMTTESMHQLFSHHSVGEIRELEKKTRGEIETKKEDLRQMVGERYRDLIEAADTIAEMKKCAAGVKDSVQSLQRYTVSELKSQRFYHNRAKNNASLNNIDRYMQVSAQVKLLMEMSETIWSRVEGGDMIEATHLYMQSRQVLKNLNLDGSTTYCPVLQWFPVLGQQAQALDNLRSTILIECRRLLRDSNLNSKPLSEALCSIILLEGVDVSKAFSEFMDARYSAIHAKFDSSIGHSAEESGSARLCKVVTLVAATLKQTHCLFVAPVLVEPSDSEGKAKKRSAFSQSKEQTDAGLVRHVLKKSCKAFSEKCHDYERSGAVSKETHWSKHLPDSVSKLASVDGRADAALSNNTIQVTCKDWLKRCEGSIQNGTLELLSYVRTFKGLATLRQALWDTLQGIDAQVTASTENGAEENWKAASTDDKADEGDWNEACQATLGRRLLLWDEILKTLFLDKVKSLSKTLFANLLNDGREKIDSALQSLQSSDRANESTNSFVWKELPGDILPDAAWRQVSVRKGREISGGLGLKALTVTPMLHSMCMQLNASMKQVLNDLSNYIPEVKKDTKGSKVSQSKPLVGAEEKSVICTDFRNSCSECLHEFLKILEAYEAPLSKRLDAEKSSVSEMLFLAMFCKNFCTMCLEFQSGCTIGEEELHPPFRKQLSSGSSMTSSMIAQSVQQIAPSPAWEKVHADMVRLSGQFLKTWSDATVKKATATFKNVTLDLKTAVQFFNTMPTWDKVAIEEESEAGSKVQSDIHIPMTASWPVLDMLYSVCEAISHVGGHSLSRSVLRDITHSCLQGVLHVYCELKKMVMEGSQAATDPRLADSLPFAPSQSWALQKLFDLRMLHGLLHSNVQSKDEAERTALFDVKEDAFLDLVDWLEGYIDPFDLDVLSPHLSKNIQRSVHSSSVMLGFITPPDKVDPLQSSHSFPKTGANSHNILPLTADCGRFSYLPISSRMSKSDSITLPASVKNQLPLSSALQQLTDVDKKMEGGRKQSLYSKLGALSSSWLSMATSEN